MGEASKIQWTHHTFNPWEGCSKVSPGCTNCYAAARDERWHEGKHWGKSAPRYLHTDSYWKQPLKWNREAEKSGERHRVFCASLADVFEDRRDLDPLRTRLWKLIEQTPSLDWLLLSKRPENMLKLVPESWELSWPLNVWAGCTMEDQERVDERGPLILKVPAVVRFASCEPLLEQVDVRKYLGPDKIGWLIVGGESGPGARFFHLNWARELILQCREVGAAPFVKQVGAAAFSTNKLGEDYELGPLRDRKGGNWDEWPQDLRVRELPAGATPRNAYGSRDTEQASRM